VCECGKILNGIHRTNPHAFLSQFLESCVITFNLGTHRTDFSERNTRTVNGETIIVGKGYKFWVAPVFLTVKIVLKRARTGGLIFGALEGTAIFLPQPSTGGIFAVLCMAKPTSQTILPRTVMFGCFLFLGFKGITQALL